MSSQNAEDRWIFDFLDSNLQYKFSLNPFKPSADSDNVSLLIMYKLIGENGKTLGAIGMNINLGVVERSIVEIGNEYNVGVAFSDLEGNIMISKDSALPKGTNIFNEGGIFQNIETKPLPLEGAVTRKWISDGGLITSKHFCEIRYLGAFNWYLIIYGSGDSIIRASITQLALQLAMLAVLLLLMIAVIINTISQYRNQIISLATLDELTKIMNRKSFMARFEYFSKQSLLEGGHLFLIDIDFFKTINDTLGHAAGDEALSFLSDKLGDCVDHEGFIGRWGGDEFIGVFFSTVADPLERVGLKITDIDKFATEMQNPDITKPAGAGDVPEANYKMIAALAVKKGQIERTEIPAFIEKHGLVGFAPTQGHIPSGAPYIGFAREDILAGNIKKAMIVGKGSLFLGRMTNLFDGVSFVIQANTSADSKESGVSEEEVKGLIAKAMKEFAASLVTE